jgi:hypothetical protein
VAKETKSQKTAYYRRCSIVPAATQTLQQMVAAAYAQKKKVKERLESIDPAASAFRLISELKSVSGMLCGTLLTFERGSYQLAIVDDPEAATLSITAVAPEKKGNAQQQFIPGVLFFVIYDNHVAVVQSTALKSSALEQHLAWLLRSHTNILAPEQGLVLADEPKKATKERIRKAHVRAVSIGKPFMTDTGPVQAAGVELATKKSKKDVSKLTPDSAVVEFIKSFLPNDKFSKLNLEEHVFDGNLEVWLEIRYPSRTRSQPEDTMKLIDNIAIALRDQDEDSVELKLADHTVVRGADLKISQPLTLKSTGGVPQVEKFYMEMMEWLTGLLKNGVVSS